MAMSSGSGRTTSPPRCPSSAAGGEGRRVGVALALAAVGVCLLVGALAVGGAWLELITFPNPFAMLPVAAMLGAAWYARPRPDRPEPALLDRGDHPALHELADALADELGSPRLDGIALTTSYDARIGRYGWRQRRVGTFGVPLLAVLAPQERAALLAHSIAHVRRGDRWRALLVGSAGNGLAALMELLEPEQMAMVVGERRYQRPSTLSRTVANLGMAVIWALVKPFALLFDALEARQVRRTEARADRLSTDVAGAPAVRWALIRSRAAYTLTTLAASAAADGDPDVIGRLRRRSTETPEREWVRIESELAAERPLLYAAPAGVDELLAGRPPRVVVSDAQAFELERELLPHEQAVSQELLERHRASIYR